MSLHDSLSQMEGPLLGVGKGKVNLHGAGVRTITSLSRSFNNISPWRSDEVEAGNEKQVLPHHHRRHHHFSHSRMTLHMGQSLTLLIRTGTYRKTPCIKWNGFGDYNKPSKAQHESKMVKQFTNELWTNILIKKSQTDQCLPLSVTNWNSALTHWKDLIIVSCQLTVIAWQQLDTSILTSQGRTEREYLESNLR